MFCIATCVCLLDLYSKSLLSINHTPGYNTGIKHMAAEENEQVKPNFPKPCCWEAREQSFKTWLLFPHPTGEPWHQVDVVTVAWRQPWGEFLGTVGILFLFNLAASYMGMLNLFRKLYSYDMCYMHFSLHMAFINENLEENKTHIRIWTQIVSFACSQIQRLCTTNSVSSSWYNFKNHLISADLPLRGSFLDPPTLGNIKKNWIPLGKWVWEEIFEILILTLALHELPSNPPKCNLPFPSNVFWIPEAPGWLSCEPTLAQVVLSWLVG